MMTDLQVTRGRPPEQPDHKGDALHIVLTCALQALGVESYECDKRTYDEATADYNALRVEFDGKVYRVTRTRRPS